MIGIGSTGVLQDPKISDIAKKHSKTSGQVILRWLIQQGFSVLPKSSSEDRISANLNIFDFELSDDDMASIYSLDRNISSVCTSENIA